MTKKTKAEEKNKGGRPTKYSSELGRKICDTIAISTHGLRKLCALNPDFPAVETLRMWSIYNEEFSAWYAKAKLHQANNLAEDCLDIADDSSEDIRITKDGDEAFNGEFAARSRLRVDTRKWLAAKLLPKQYGMQQQIETLEGQNDALRAELRELRAELDEKYKKDY